jgi:hypothetical protein
MRENCLEQFESHWGCLELNNQVRWGLLELFYYFIAMLMFNGTAILPLPRARARPQHMHV